MLHLLSTRLSHLLRAVSLPSPKLQVQEEAARAPNQTPNPVTPARVIQRKLPVALALDASASSVSRTEGHVTLPTAPTPPQGAAPTSGANVPQARPSSSEAQEDDDWLGVSDEALAKYFSKK